MPEPGNHNELRREHRSSVESLVMPFLGSRESDHQPFQYLIEDASPHGARIALPNWVVSRERLRKDDLINLHLPFRLGEATFDQGRIVWSKWEADKQAQICGLRLEETAASHYPVYINLDGEQGALDLQHFASAEGLVTKMIKDTHLLKKGVGIYLEHLIPYFSRVGDYPREDFQALKEFFLAGVQEQVRAHQARLHDLCVHIRDHKLPDAEAILLLDMEQMRELSESELPMDIMDTTFPSPLAAQQLAAIKSLEKRLYSNYNTIVMLYLKSLSAA